MSSSTRNSVGRGRLPGSASSCNCPGKAIALAAEETIPPLEEGSRHLMIFSSGGCSPRLPALASGCGGGSSGGASSATGAACGGASALRGRGGSAETGSRTAGHGAAREVVAWLTSSLAAAAARKPAPTGLRPRELPTVPDSPPLGVELRESELPTAPDKPPPDGPPAGGELRNNEPPTDPAKPAPPEPVLGFGLLANLLLTPFIQSDPVNPSPSCPAACAPSLVDCAGEVGVSGATGAARAGGAGGSTSCAG